METKELREFIQKLKRAHQYKEVYELTKKLYENEEASDEMEILYARCLILKENYEQAQKILWKHYSNNNFKIIQGLFHTSFEMYQFEDAQSYLEDVKLLIHYPRPRKELVPFEIYLSKINGLDISNICRTKSARYLSKQIDEYDKERAINFINDNNNHQTYHFEDIDMQSLFYLSLDHVIIHERSLQCTPFQNKFCLFDKYYMPLNNIGLPQNAPYKYAEISTLPFSNNICMIAPSNQNKTLKKLK